MVVDAANAEPLGLYFAGGTDDHGGGLSVATPIQDVLAALDAEAGHQFSIVGGEEHPVSCLNYDGREVKRARRCLMPSKEGRSGHPQEAPPR